MRLAYILPVVVLLVVVLIPVPASAGVWTNGLRRHYGVPVLRHSDYLSYKAKQWAERLASAGVIKHGDLPCFCGWRNIGQNVGVGPTWWSVEQAFQQSPEHRANLLDPSYKQIGVGVVESGGEVYVVQDFRG